MGSPPPTNQWSHLNGVLKCQVKNDFAGFGEKEDILGVIGWSGIEVELCNAIAAAIGVTPTYFSTMSPLFGLTEAVNTTALNIPPSLGLPEILPPSTQDILIRQVTKTTQRETEYYGLPFVPPVLFGPTYFYDRGALGLLASIYGPDGTNPYTGIESLDNATICVGTGTVYPDLLTQAADAAGITIHQKLLTNKGESVPALQSRACVGTPGDFYGQVVPFASQFATIGLDLIIPDDIQLGFQPLAVVNRQNDANQLKLSEVAREVFDALIKATELEKTQSDSWPATSTSQNRGQQLGLVTNWREVVLQEGGNWEEILVRQVSNGVPNLWSGKNTLVRDGGFFMSHLS